MKSFEIGSGDQAATKKHFGKPLQAIIELYEDNAGGLHLYQHGRALVVGGLSCDGGFADDAQSLAEGGVWLHDWNGQIAYDFNELRVGKTNGARQVATYDPRTRAVTLTEDAPGSAAREYLGLRDE